MIREDEALFYFENSGLSLPRYSTVMASLGENEYVTIGYPSVCGNDIRISFVRYIAINKNFMEKETDKKKVIEDFLNCLYMPEYNNESMSSLVPVRLDAFEGKILMAGDYDYLSSPALKLDDRTYTSIAAKRDGSTYVDDYLELLKNYDNLFYVDTDEAVIREIVFEETEPFFNGAKTAEETARTIQNRVSLYLMENG